MNYKYIAIKMLGNLMVAVCNKDEYPESDKYSKYDDYVSLFEWRAEWKNKHDVVLIAAEHQNVIKWYVEDEMHYIKHPNYEEQWKNGTEFPVGFVEIKEIEFPKIDFPMLKTKIKYAFFKYPPKK